MPVGRLSEEEYQAEMQKGKTPRKESHPPIQEVEIVDKPRRGRAPGEGNIPDVLRKIVGEAGVIDGRQSALQLAEEFNISPSSASAYAAGSTSTKTYNTPSSSILQHIQKSRIRAVKRATGTLNGALGAITQEKLDYTDAKDLSTIAKNMSVVIKNLEPPTDTTSQDSNSSTSPKFVIFAPQFRKEDSFEVIDVKE